MDKRGEEHHLFYAFEAILGILVAGILISTAANFDSISNINKLYAQDDLNLLMVTLNSAQGDITYDYQMKALYDVSIEENKVKVTKNSDFLAGYSYYNLTLEKEQNTDQIKVSKHA